MLGLKNTKAFRVVSLCFAISFFLCRVLPLPFYWTVAVKAYMAGMFKQSFLVRWTFFFAGA